MALSIADRMENTCDITERIAFNQENALGVIRFISEPDPAKRQVFICPVRDSNPEQQQLVAKHLEEAQKAGVKVYWPYIHNDQNDETGGILICNTMAFAIRHAGLVKVYLDLTSEESRVDMGIAAGLEKKIGGLNLDDPTLDRRDPMYKVVSEISEHGYRYPSDWLEPVYAFADKINANAIVPIRLDYAQAAPGKPPQLKHWSAVKLGMVFASKKPFRVENPEDVVRQIALENNYGRTKSYSRVALALSGIYAKRS
ncbi:hypothetical protein JW711_04170 [Candidatus Woesearchaeota archaeon]|nr:hypothetical protein [Candidatus Woesearchaeota archaeon]